MSRIDSSVVGIDVLIIDRIDAGSPRHVVDAFRRALQQKDFLPGRLIELLRRHLDHRRIGNRLLIHVVLIDDADVVDFLRHFDAGVGNHVAVCDRLPVAVIIQIPRSVLNIFKYRIIVRTRAVFRRFFHFRDVLHVERIVVDILSARIHRHRECVKRQENRDRVDYAERNKSFFHKIPSNNPFNYK